MKRIVPGNSNVILDGFNNLTKSLSFYLYDFCIARNEYERQTYVDYIQNKFNASAITTVLKGICDIIEANVLAISDQNYDPWGASSLVLMSDLKGGGQTAFHLDKSHICAHTYPDFRSEGTICSFRIDIEISTCGEISPLKALNFMFDNFPSDVVILDYKVRGSTKNKDGKRIYMDHDIRSIQEFIHPEILKDYHCVDLAIQSENIWQTKMLKINQDKPTYFLNGVFLNTREAKDYLDLVHKEMKGILHNWTD